MNILKAKRTRYYLRLAYPVRITTTDDGFCGTYPDLPGCNLYEADLPTLYRNLQGLRRQWITERVLADLPIAPPNAHLLSDEERTEQVA
jgi:predicted RNase H-like HicB family nuclease